MDCFFDGFCEMSLVVVVVVVCLEGTWTSLVLVCELALGVVCLERTLASLVLISVRSVWFGTGIRKTVWHVSFE